MFALLVIFSLLPVGLQVLQSSNRQVAETEIFNTLGAELSSTKFSELETYVDGDRFPIYFDNEAIEVEKDNAVFTVICELADPELSGELRRATVSIGYRGDPNDANLPKYNIHRRTFLLADKGL